MKGRDMAKKVAPTAPAPVHAPPPTGTRVIVRGVAGPEEHYVSEEPRSYHIRIDGVTYHHVADDADGTWIYAQGS
jgi:hypothetical protein